VTFTFTVSPTRTATPNVGDVFYVSRNSFDPAQGPVSIHVEYNRPPGALELWIYNSAGEHIRTLESTRISAPFIGDYTWDGRNKYGDTCASGMYILYLVEPLDRKIKRVLLIR
jgi:flagellar hook assembly protein FlgD